MRKHPASSVSLWWGRTAGARRGGRSPSPRPPKQSPARSPADYPFRDTTGRARPVGDDADRRPDHTRGGASPEAAVPNSLLHGDVAAVMGCAPRRSAWTRSLAAEPASRLYCVTPMPPDAPHVGGASTDAGPRRAGSRSPCRCARPRASRCSSRWPREPLDAVNRWRAAGCGVGTDASWTPSPISYRGFRRFARTCRTSASTTPMSMWGCAIRRAFMRPRKRRSTRSSRSTRAR